MKRQRRSARALAFDDAACAARMRSLIERLAPLARMVNSPGLDQSFRILAKELPSLKVHEYEAGASFEDWVVPKSWEVLRGELSDERGNVIASTSESLLFVAPYSEPVDGWFTKDEIAAHLRTRPDRPGAFALEHRHAYDYTRRTWGITLPHERWTAMRGGRYRVRIETRSGPGSMKVGEGLLRGQRSEVINISAHIDELCDDDLSGCVVAIELYRWLESLPERRYTYQLLLAPEMFGTLAFVHANPRVVRRTRGMLNLEILGGGGELTLKRAWKPGSLVERALRAALRQHGAPFKELSFFEGFGNDEKIYAWPTIDVPGAALQRHPFPEYHTSDDTPDRVKDSALLEALGIARGFCTLLEQDYVPRYTRRLQPWLTRHGLYFDATLEPASFLRLNCDVLFGIDGKTSLLELSERAGLSFVQVREFVERFAEKGLLRRLPPP